MAVHLKDPRVHVEDANGNPYVGARLYVYDTGGTVLQSIWTDSALSVAAANPLTSDSSGYFALTYLTAGTYKVRIEQSDGTLIIEADNQDTGIPLGSGVLAIANGGTGGATPAAARTALGVPANSEITTITSDVLARLKRTGGALTGDTDNSGTGFFSIPSGTTAQQATPASGTGLRFNSTTGQLEAYISSAWTELVALPTGYIDGLVLSNNATDANNDIDISAGACRNAQSSNSDTTNLRLSSSITKQIDASWAVGTNAGGLDGGAVADSTWYHVFIIHDSENFVTDVLFSSSATSPTLPTNYTKSRRIGAVLTDGSSNIIAFTQVGSRVIWDNPAVVSSSSVNTTAILMALNSPLGIQCEAEVNFYGTDGGTRNIYISHPDADDEAPSESAPPLFNLRVPATANVASKTVVTNELSQIRIRSDAGVATFRASTLSYVDPRGTNG